MLYLSGLSVISLVQILVNCISFGKQLMSGSGRGRRERYVWSRVDDILDEWIGWPQKFIKLHLEIAGLYQNEVGKVLDQMVDSGEVDRISAVIDNNPRKFIVRSTVDEIDGTEIHQLGGDMYQFFSDSGYFSNLTAYVALCKVYDELSDYIDIEVLPEGTRPHALYHAGDREPDACIRFPKEYAPVEVYNGADYLSTHNTDKMGQLRDLSSNEHHDVVSNPLLINRLADDDVRKVIREEENGMVVDTRHIMTTESLYNEYEYVIDTFNLHSMISALSPMEAADGNTLNGGEYNSLSRDSTGAARVRPPSDMITDADNLPEEYMKRIRGGVQLLYVNSIYRHSGDPARRDACLVVQRIYNQLLRDSSRERQTAIQRGWQGAKGRYDRIRQIESEGGGRKELVLNQVRDLLRKLQNENILTKQGNRISARKALHPQPMLSF